MIKTRVHLLLFAGALAGAQTATAQTCPQTSAEVTHDPPQLEQFATAGSGGVVFDTTAQDLTLNRQGGSVSAQLNFVSTSRPSSGCAADFTGDGYPDFVGALSDGSKVGFWRNDTADNYTPPGTWTDPSYVLTPKFTFTGWFEIPVLKGSGGSATACADFSGDGHADFILVEGGDGTSVYRADIFLGHGDGTFDPAYPITADLSQYDGLRLDATTYVYDADLDGDLDFLLPTRTGTTAFGTVQLFVNSGGSSPTFTPDAVLLTDAATGNYGATGVVYLDYNRDGVRDLVVASVSLNGLRLYYGLAGGGFDAPITLTDANWPSSSDTGAQVLAGGDFDLDGYNDLFAATNKGGGANRVFIWRDSGAPDYITNKQADIELTHTFSDTDLGFAMDYDNDPAHTPDFVLVDNAAGDFAFANRLYSQFVPCAEIASDVVDLGALSGSQMVITAARLDATAVDPDGAGDATITWSMSNEEPANWQPANPCADDPTQYCVAFPQPTGQSVRWRAELCTNTGATLAPTISEVKVSFDYTVAATHLRAGVVVDAGIAYVGAFQQPGEAGHFYATSAALDDRYWDAADTIDALADPLRKVYTSTLDGTTRLDFTAADATNPDLQAVLGVSTDTDAADIVTWQRGARFGIGSTSRLGGILTSTAAVIAPPPRPYYYNNLAPTEKAKFDAFATAYATRPRLVLFGSKDGAIHAMSVDLTTPVNGGAEMWAFIPPRIANGFVADKLASKSDNYPDGSPTLADVKIGGQYRTVALIGSGNGGKSVMALDVTDSAIAGPIPLWDYVPGGGGAGQTLSKPAVIRVRNGASDRFLAVMASGVDYNNMSAPYSKGLDVEAIDIGTGARAWRFRAECPITTSVIGFETDDDLEPGSVAIDGYVDRVMFADLCGNVYKVNPAVDLPGNAVTDGWTVGLGTDTGADDPAGNNINALFSVASSSIGEDRPIAGTIGAHPDDSGRMIIFFGTGGAENFDVTKVNGFFAIYADDGSVRDQITGQCTGPNGACDKFYGGIVVTNDQVLATRAIDPPIATSSCDLGSAAIVGFDLTDLSTQSTMFTGSAAIVSALYGDRGAIYATTVGGQVIKVGTPSTPSPGAGGPPPPPPPPPSNAVKRRTWRELLD